MREAAKIKFPEFEFQSKASLKKCKSLNAELDEIYGHRADHNKRANARATAEGTSFEQAYHRQDAKGQHIDTFLEEKNLLESAADTVESLIDEAVQMVRENESNSNTAFARIRAEIAGYGLIWASDNQFDLFVRKSQAMEPFEGKATDARQFEKAARNLVGAIRERCGWIHNFVISERSKLASVV